MRRGAIYILTVVLAIAVAPTQALAGTGNAATTKAYIQAN